MASNRSDHSHADYSPTFADSRVPRTIAVTGLLVGVLLGGIYLIARGLM